MTDLLHAVRDAFDPLPLGFHLLVRPFVRATAWPHVMARVPSIAGFGAMLVGLWVVARRRMGPSNALIAFAFPCLTTAAVVYSVEARPYGLVLGFAALALVFWQAACERQPGWSRNCGSGDGTSRPCRAIQGTFWRGLP